MSCFDLFELKFSWFEKNCWITWSACMYSINKDKLNKREGESIGSLVWVWWSDSQGFIIMFINSSPYVCHHAYQQLILYAINLLTRLKKLFIHSIKSQSIIFCNSEQSFFHSLHMKGSIQCPTNSPNEKAKFLKRYLFQLPERPVT